MIHHNTISENNLILWPRHRNKGSRFGGNQEGSNNVQFHGFPSEEDGFNNDN